MTESSKPTIPESVVQKKSLEEKTVFELFGSDESKEPFLKIEYPGIINLNEGDHVNVIAESKSDERCILGQDGLLMPRDVLYFPPNEYIVKNPSDKGIVNMTLRIGGEKNPLEKYYTLVRVKSKY